MNLLVKRLKVAAVLLLPLFFVSCEDPGKIGLDIDPKNSIIIAKSKEFVLPSTQVQFNPRATTSSSFFQAGSYTDIDLGKINTKSYSWLSIQESLPTLSTSATYTGINLSIQFAAIYGSEGVDLEVQTFGIYQLDQALEADTEYTRVDELQLGPLLGTANMFMQENDTLRTDSIFQVPISDAFGELIFNKIAANDPVFESEESFNAFIKGIAIIPDANSNKVVLFNKQTFRIKINYTEINSAGELVERTYNFGLGKNNFYHIDSDLSGTPLNGMLPNNQEFEPNNEYRYLQAGTMISLKVDLNPIYNYLNDELNSDTVSNIIVQKASLSLGELEANKPGAAYPISLRGYFTNTENTWPALAETSPDADEAIALLQNETISGNIPMFPGFYGAPQDFFFSEVDSLEYKATMSNFLQNIVFDGYNTGKTPLEQGGEMLLFVPTSLTTPQATPQTSPSHTQTHFFKVHQDSIIVELYYSVTNL